MDNFLGQGIYCVEVIIMNVFFAAKDKSCNKLTNSVFSFRSLS